MTSRQKKILFDLCLYFARLFFQDLQSQTRYEKPTVFGYTEDMESFSQWYYRVVVGNGLKIWQSLIILTFDTFSVPLLIRTLFAPWRRDVVQPSQPGLNLIFQAIAFNFVSRLIGLIIRSATIGVGITLTLLVIVVGAVSLLVLAALPTIIFLGIMIGFIFWTNPVLVGTGLTIVFGSFIGLTIAYLYYRQIARLNPPLPEPLPKMLEKLHGGKGVNVEPYIEGHVAAAIKNGRTVTELFQRLLSEPDVRFICIHANLQPTRLTRLTIPETIDLRSVLAQAAELAKTASLERITAAAVFVAIIQVTPALEKILPQFKLTIDDLVIITHWYHRLYRLTHQPSPLLDPSHLKSTGGVGRDWAYGYTPTLDQFTHEITAQLTRSFGDHYLAHREEIDQVERVLARSGKHNVLLIGEPGIGKRTVLLGLAWRMHGGQTLRPLRHKRVIELDVSAVLAGVGVAGDLEARLVRLLNEAVTAGNIILFVDRIERLFNTQGGGAGTVNAGQILIPYLESSALQLVGTTSFADYHKFFETIPGVMSQFERVEVHEPRPEQVQVILEELAPYFEARQGIIVSYQALQEVIAVADRYLKNRKFPEKAISLLDEATVHLSSSRHLPVSHTEAGQSVLLPSHVDEVVSQKTNVPVGQLQAEEQETLLNLDELLHRRIVNQQEAIEAITASLRRARAGVARTDRPIGTFLFLGPTGVGKTETAKSLAAIYFGSEKAMVRLDMNEYQEVPALNRLIGGAGFESGGLLTNAVKEKPFTVVLLDEIEKAHPSILNALLQLLDEGQLQDGLGNVIDFTNTMMIGTSNAGAEFIREQIQEVTSVIASEAEASAARLSGTQWSGSEAKQSPQEISNLKSQISNKVQNPNDQDPKHNDLKEQLLEYLQHNNIFRPEFLNRFDAIVTFRTLTKEELMKVVVLHIERINRNLADKQMSILVTPQAVAKLAEIGFDPQFGARALARAIQQKVENLIADRILRNQLQAGGVLEITEEMIG